MLLEQHRAHVGQVDHGVDDGEAGVRKFLGHLLDRRGLQEADADDGIVAARGELAMRLGELRVVADLEVAIGDAGFLGEAFGPHVGALVEGAVELVAHGIDRACPVITHTHNI